MKDNKDGNAKNRTRRILTSFWIFGLCNNYAFVVLLSAANDILGEYAGKNSNQISYTTTWNSSTDLPSTVVLRNTTEQPVDTTEYLYCNTLGTAVILIANIVPCFVVKLIFPFFMDMSSYDFKVILTGLFSAASFIIVAFAHQLWLSLLGVVCASISAGLGENAFLALSSFYDKNVVSTWSSGTGGAGLLGAASYAGLTSAGLSPRHTLLTMVSVPTCMMLSYKFLLVENSAERNRTDEDIPNIIDDDDENMTILEHKRTDKNVLSMRTKLLLLRSLLKYMFPLAAIYVFEYFINQGLVELLYFNAQFLTREEQYRWYQTAYQLGVFIARSSVNLFVVRKLWILPILQFANVILLIFQVFYRFIPSLWIILAVVLWEGLLGGASYVSTLYLMAIELADDVKEYGMGVATMAEAIGIIVAAVAAQPTHNRICSLNLKM